MRRPPQLGQKPRPLHEKRHQPLERALCAPQAREAVRRDPARQEVPDLLLDERGQRGAVRLTPGRLEELAEMLVDHAVQHRVLGKRGR
jgi:hypothetical protein